MRWTAYHLVRMVGLFVCWKEATKQSGNEPRGQSVLFQVTLSFTCYSHAGAPTNASADRFQYLIRAGVGCVSLASLPCLYASVNMLFGPRAVCLASLYRFHTVRAACKPFSVLPSCSARFINGTISLCITESGLTSLKTG